MANQAEVAAAFGIRPPYEPDEPSPASDVFPTDNKTPFYGAVVVQDGADRTVKRVD